MSNSPQSTSDGHETAQPYYARRDQDEDWMLSYCVYDGHNSRPVANFATEGLALLFLSECLTLFYSDRRSCLYDLDDHARANEVKKGDPWRIERLGGVKGSSWHLYYEDEVIGSTHRCGDLAPISMFQTLESMDPEVGKAWMDEYALWCRQDELRVMRRDPWVEKLFRYAHALDSEAGQEHPFDEQALSEFEYALECWRGYELPA